MQKWEYSSIWVSSNQAGSHFIVQYNNRKYKDNEILGLINEWGGRGWELVTVLSTHQGHVGTVASQLLFKRPIE
jgi:hypothetical protein